MAIENPPFTYSQEKTSICRECPVATLEGIGHEYSTIPLLSISPPQKKHIKLPVNLHVFMVNWYVNQVTGIRRQIRRLTLFTLAPQICPRDFKCGSNPKCMVFTGKSNSNGLAQWSLDPQPRFITRIFLNWDHSPF